MKKINLLLLSLLLACNSSLTAQAEQAQAEIISTRIMHKMGIKSTPPTGLNYYTLLLTDFGLSPNLFAKATNIQDSVKKTNKKQVVIDAHGAIIRGDVSRKEIALVFTGDEFAD